MSLSNLARLLSMGCVCARETINVGNKSFSVRSRLGEGGFSYVDLVEDRYNRKLYALKRLSCHSREDEKLALKEIEYMRKIEHLNLVPCTAHGKVPIQGHRSIISEVYIAMPFYRKGSLWDEIEFLSKTGEHMKESKILQVLRGVCEGLQALHTLTPVALAHRDVKPHNVMFEDDDTPVLMDFGSMGPATVEIKGSSEARAMTDLAAERCTMPYRAPELFTVESYCTIDDKVDIWSLGCTLYAMCYHESPFDAAHQRGDSIALAVLSGITKIPDTPQYSENLKDLIMSLVVVNPSERPNIHKVIQRVDLLANEQENRV